MTDEGEIRPHSTTALHAKKASTPTDRNDVVSNYRLHVPNGSLRKTIQRNKKVVEDEDKWLVFDELAEHESGQLPIGSLCDHMANGKGLRRFCDGDFPDSDSDDNEHGGIAKSRRITRTGHQTLSDEQRDYEAACRLCGVRVIQQLSNSLNDRSLKVKAVTLSTKDTKACAIALLSNTDVESIHLEGNGLGGTSSRYIADVMKNNVHITELRIVDNNLGNDGAKALCKALEDNTSCLVVDLSGNSFTENEAVHFKHLLEENSGIRRLYLNHNFFGEKGGEALASGLECNDRLRVLDLSWNHLRMNGAAAIGQALTLGMNPLTAEGAFSILKQISDDVGSSIKFLDFGDQAVEDKFEELLLETKNDRELEVTHGHVIKRERFGKPVNVSNSASGALAQLQKAITGEPMVVLMEFMRLQNYRLVDLFKCLDQDGSATLTRQEFENGLRSVNIPLADEDIRSLVRSLDRDGNGVVDYSELVKGQKEHRMRMLELMKGDIPIENTEIGVISEKIRSIMKQEYIMRKE